MTHWVTRDGRSLFIARLSFPSAAVFRSGLPGSVPWDLRRSERTDCGGERQQAQEGEFVFAADPGRI